MPTTTSVAVQPASGPSDVELTFALRAARRGDPLAAARESARRTQLWLETGLGVVGAGIWTANLVEVVVRLHG